MKVERSLDMVFLVIGLFCLSVGLFISVFPQGKIIDLIPFAAFFTWMIYLTIMGFKTKTNKLGFKETLTLVLEKLLFAIALCLLVVGVSLVFNLGSGGLFIGLFFAYIVYRMFYKSTSIYRATPSNYDSDFITQRQMGEVGSSNTDTYASDFGFGLATGINNGSLGSIVGSTLHSHH